MDTREKDLPILNHALWCREQAETWGHVIGPTRLRRPGVGLRDRVTIICDRCHLEADVYGGTYDPQHHWNGLDAPCKG